MKRVLALIIMLILIIDSVYVANAAVIGTKHRMNSWRYSDGELQGVAQSGVGVDAWSKTDEGYINSYGDIIDGATMKGIDVSEWNGNIDWQKVAESDVDYAIIRLGYGDDYSYQDDKYFYQNVEGCVSNKIPFGVYIYSYAENVEMANSEADHTLRMIEELNLSFPVFYDMEDNCQANLSASMRGKIAKTYCDRLTAKNYQVGIYANLNWWNNYLTDPVFDNTKWYRWVAQYNYQCDYQNKYCMWQCTSSGKVDGIKGNVDINFWYNPVRKNTYSIRQTKVTLSKTSYTFSRKATNPTYTLKAIVGTAVVGADKGVTWSTSNSKIATVNQSGKVTAKKKGTCDIIATAKDGSNKTAKCKITVKQLVTKIKLNRTKYTIKKKGKTVILKATATPTNANNKSVSWKSSKKSVATVNTKGKVTAKKKGTCYIIATVKDGSKKTAKCKITVKK